MASESERLSTSLKWHRTRANLTQAELADAVGVSRKTINTVENGVFIPSTLLALKLSKVLGVRVEDLFSVERQRAFPVVLGGDCTIMLGSTLALRRRGRYGLLFIDGNADFFQPEAEPNGEGASMDLAFVTGYGPPLLTDIEARGPLVRPEDAVAFAYRDHKDQEEYGSQPLPEELMALDLSAARTTGIEAAARQAVEHLTRAELDGFFIHLDADCLDDIIMPAVDFRAGRIVVGRANGHAPDCVGERQGSRHRDH